ncbi:hypothetical protein Tco_0240723 [Tanacetum coccineum]
MMHGGSYLHGFGVLGYLDGSITSSSADDMEWKCMHFLSMIDTINVVVVTISAAVAAITMAADFSMAPNHPFGPSPGRMGGVFLARILGNIRSSLRLGVHRSSTPASMGQ